MKFQILYLFFQVVGMLFVTMLSLKKHLSH